MFCIKTKCYYTIIFWHKHFFHSHIPQEKYWVLCFAKNRSVWFLNNVTVELQLNWERVRIWCTFRNTKVEFLREETVDAKNVFVTNIVIDKALFWFKIFLSRQLRAWFLNKIVSFYWTVHGSKNLVVWVSSSKNLKNSWWSCKLGQTFC